MLECFPTCAELLVAEMLTQTCYRVWLLSLVTRPCILGTTVYKGQADGASRRLHCTRCIVSQECCRQPQAPTGREAIAHGGSTCKLRKETARHHRGHVKVANLKASPTGDMHRTKCRFCCTRSTKAACIASLVGLRPWAWRMGRMTPAISSRSSGLIKFGTSPLFRMLLMSWTTHESPVFTELGMHSAKCNMTAGAFDHAVFTTLQDVIDVLYNTGEPHMHAFSKMQPERCCLSSCSNKLVKGGV